MKKRWLRKALAIQDVYYGQWRNEGVSVLSNLGNTLGILGDYHKSKELLEQALRMQQSDHNENLMETVNILNSLATTVRALGDHQASKLYLEQALVIQQSHYNEHQTEIANTLNNLATTWEEPSTSSKGSCECAVFYILKTGCQWRFLPSEYLPWKTVDSFYKRSKDKGIWEKMMRDRV